MAATDVEQDGRRTAWRNPVLRFEGSCRAPAEVVYDLLADLQSHLEWPGRRPWLCTAVHRYVIAPAAPRSGLGRQRTRTHRGYKSDWQISGKRRLAALGHATGRV
jgi:hypothetical protein